MIILNPFDHEDNDRRRFALVVYMGPCDTLPKPQAYLYVEPQLRILAHQRDDRWLMTHELSYVLFRKGDLIRTFDAVRVQYPERWSKFYCGDELIRQVERNSNA